MEKIIFQIFLIKIKGAYTKIGKKKFRDISGRADPPIICS